MCIPFFNITVSHARLDNAVNDDKGATHLIRFVSAKNTTKVDYCLFQSRIASIVDIIGGNSPETR